MEHSQTHYNGPNSSFPNGHASELSNNSPAQHNLLIVSLQLWNVK